MAKISLKCDGKKGNFFEPRRGFLMVSGLKEDKDGDFLLHPVDYRSAKEVEATVNRLKRQLDLVLEKARKQLQP